MRIVYLYRSIAIKRGIERTIVQKANLLSADKQNEVYIVTYEQGNHPYSFPLSNNVKTFDLNIRILQMYHLHGLKRYVYGYTLKRKLLKEGGRFLRSLNPDIIVCSVNCTLDIECALKARMCAKVVVEGHMAYETFTMYNNSCHFLRKWVSNYKRYKLRTAVSHSDLMVCLTKADENFWKSYTSTCLIPNMLTEKHEGKIDNDLCFKRVLAVGALTFQKGYDMLLRAWETVEQRYPDWHLDIIGDGEEEDSLRRQKQQLALEHVTFLPSTLNVYEEYCQSDFLVFSSRFEGFGMVLIEAMSCGIPCVSFDCPSGPAEIIEDRQTGLLVKSLDIEGLAQKICYMIENEKERRNMGRCARKAAERFRPETVLSQWYQVFNQLLSLR